MRIKDKNLTIFKMKIAPPPIVERSSNILGYFLVI